MAKLIPTLFAGVLILAAACTKSNTSAPSSGISCKINGKQRSFNNGITIDTAMDGTVQIIGHEDTVMGEPWSPVFLRLIHTLSTPGFLKVK